MSQNLSLAPRCHAEKLGGWHVTVRGRYLLLLASSSSNMSTGQHVPVPPWVWTLTGAAAGAAAVMAWNRVSEKRQSNADHVTPAVTRYIIPSSAVVM